MDSRTASEHTNGYKQTANSRTDYSWRPPSDLTANFLYKWLKEKLSRIRHGQKKRRKVEKERRKETREKQRREKEEEESCTTLRSSRRHMFLPKVHKNFSKSVHGVEIGIRFDDELQGGMANVDDRKPVGVSTVRHWCRLQNLNELRTRKTM